MYFLPVLFVHFWFPVNFQSRNPFDLTENGVKNAAESLNQVKEQIREKHHICRSGKIPDYRRKSQVVDPK